MTANLQPQSLEAAKDAFTEGRAVASDLASLVERAKASSACEIDHVITELQMLRERLDADGARIQRDLVEYATFSESTVNSLNVISECLRNRFPNENDRKLVK